MLESLSLQNFVVIDKADLEFADGLTALIGETGAGKSVLIAALSATLGGKVTTAQLKDKSRKLYAESVFKLDSDFVSKHPRLADYLEGETKLILSVSLTPKGLLTRKINGQTTTLTALREAIEGLADIHSQRETSGLYERAEQLALLDRFGGKEGRALLNTYQSDYDEWQRSLKAIESLKASVKDADPDFLKFRIEEIEKFDLKPNEIEDAEEKLSALNDKAQAEKYQQELGNYLSQMDQILTAVRGPLTSLSGLNGEIAGHAAAALDDLNSFEEELQSLSDENSDEDAYLVEQLNSRLFSLEKLRSRYGRSTNDILSALDSFKKRLNDLQDYEGNLDILKRDADKALSKLKSSGEILSEFRKKSASILEKKVCSHMSDLGLAKSGFKVSFERSETPDRTGFDKIDYLVSLNKGADFTPLRKACSGGESSRIMLSLKTALALNNSDGLAVFDEIDTGISGAIAFKAGHKLKELSKEVQVICITHLAQVAAFADQGIYVSKSISGEETVVSATPFDKDGKVDKIATLLSGDKASQAAIEASKELISEAERTK